MTVSHRTVVFVFDRLLAIAWQVLDVVSIIVFVPVLGERAGPDSEHSVRVTDVAVAVEWPANAPLQCRPQGVLDESQQRAPLTNPCHDLWRDLTAPGALECLVRIQAGGGEAAAALGVQVTYAVENRRIGVSGSSGNRRCCRCPENKIPRKICYFSGTLQMNE